MEKLIVSSSPHVKSQRTTHFFMQDVILALIPAVIMSVIYFSLRALFVVAISVCSAVLFELLYTKLTRKPTTIGDCSAIVTGLLLGMNLPVTVPLYLPVIGAAFAIVVVKMLYGGLGKNIANPAIAARIFLFISYSKAMTNWVAPTTSVGQNASSLPLFANVDAISAATPLSYLKDGDKITSIFTNFSLGKMFAGSTSGCIGETCAVLLLLGGIFLLCRKVITWHIPVSFIGTVAFITFVFPKYTTIPRLDFMLYHLLGGGLMLGAFFMATDYATSPTTPKGRIIYGCGCGVLTVLIRYFGGYPEGVSFAILIMNFFAWYIDGKTIPHKFGGESGGFKWLQKLKK